MAKIKKLQESGETIYPATITNAIKDPETGKTLPEMLGDGVQSDGLYPQMSVGFAEHLVGDGTATEEEFSFRPTAGVDRNVETTTYDYDLRSNFAARIEAVKGNSVVWNQKARQAIVGIYTRGGWFNTAGSIEKNENNIYTVSAETAKKNRIGQFINLDYTHTYLITFGVMLTSELEDGSYKIGYLGESTTQWLGEVSMSEVYNKRKDFAVFIQPESSNTSVYLGIYANLTSQIIYSPCVHDLTQMFGAGNEPTTVEEFYARLPKGVDLNAYNVGEIVNAHYGAIKTTGFNQFNGNYAKVLGGYPYYLGGTYTSVGFTTEEGGTTEAITIPSNKLYTPSQNGYIHAEGRDICINLAWDEYSALNGTYAPYKPFERDLSWVAQYFPEGMRRAGSVSDEIRFNSTTQKWEAVKNVEVRAYTSGDEGDTTLTTDGTNTNYPLATPIVTEIEEIPNLDYDVADYGTEELIVADGVKSAPFLGDIIYTPNAEKTLWQVPDILKRLTALETAMTTTTTTTE